MGTVGYSNNKSAGSRKEDQYAFVETDKYLDFVLENLIGIPTGNIVKSVLIIILKSDLQSGINKENGRNV